MIEDVSNIRWGFQKAIDIKSGVTTLEQAMQEQLLNSNNSHQP